MKSDNKKSGKNQERPAKGRPNEIPEKRESENERSEYPHEIEQEQQQSGSDAAYSEQAGVTPLHSAAQNGNLDMLILLLEAGAQVNVRMEGGKLPADLAREKGFVEIAEALV